MLNISPFLSIIIGNSPIFDGGTTYFYCRKAGGAYFCPQTIKLYLL